MSTKFADFITEKKLDARRIIAASGKIEKLRPEDRKAKLSKRQAKAKAAAGKADDKKGEAPAKPRSGRPVTQRAFDAAVAGKAISGPQKTRMLRAVNAVLEQKKGAAVELTALF
jgi:pyruvate/2-oxoglutarate dehydrogenase complex dihydrolipoamide acyltransferase (E2) component